MSLFCLISVCFYYYVYLLFYVEFNDLFDLFMISATKKQPPKLNIVDKLGMSFEMALTNIFTEMGTLFARYPIPVIFLSIGFAAGLSTGILWLDVTTDPIELWASPESRSRIEKDFFDKTFRPFYRTEQIIIKAKNLSTVI